MYSLNVSIMPSSARFRKMEQIHPTFQCLARGDERDINLLDDYKDLTPSRTIDVELPVESQDSGLVTEDLRLLSSTLGEMDGDDILA